MFPYRHKGQFKDARAQFFTPWTVAECMASISLMDAEAICIKRLKQAVEGNPLAEALALMTTAFPEEAERLFFKRLPYAVDKAEPLTVADICCGSGVMLLGTARQFPRWAIDGGLVQFYGVDAEHHQRLFEERVTRAEALARSLGLQRLTFGPIKWWFDDEGNFYWRGLETPEVDGWEQGRLPGCDIDNEETSKWSYNFSRSNQQQKPPLAQLGGFAFAGLREDD